MSMYGMTAFPLIDMMVDDQNLTPKWQADDDNVAGSFESLQFLAHNFYEHGGALVYNVIKFHLITKLEFV